MHRCARSWVPEAKRLFSAEINKGRLSCAAVKDTTSRVTRAEQSQTAGGSEERLGDSARAETHGLRDPGTGSGRFCSLLPAQGPSTCYHSPRSWKDNPALPAGLLYQGVCEEPLAFSGGSAAQSTVLHAFDELLGIQHGPDSGESRASLWAERRGQSRARATPAAPVSALAPSPSPAGPRRCPGFREEACKEGSDRHLLTAGNSQRDRLCFLHVNFLLSLYIGTEMREQSDLAHPSTWLHMSLARS